MRHRCLVVAALLASSAARGWAQDEPRVQRDPPRWQLAASFVKRDSAALRRYLTPDVMIWPPPPDTARRGSAAVRYFIDLASSSRLTRSDFRPREVTADGAYLIEGGEWTLTQGRTRVRARYDMRWRRSGDRWQVSFLRWELFR